MSNVAKFISLFEGISYRQALGILARKIGKKDLAPETVDEASDIFEVNEIVAGLYQQVLFDKNEISVKARETLRNRHITQETAQLFGLGYSPNNWTWLVGQGLNKKLLRKAGLLKRSDAGKHRDFFKNRIIFPIYHQKQLVGFTGRTLGTARKIPKYLNSSDSDWYRKREVIYGWDINNRSIRKHKEIVIVEGQFDLLQLHQRGITNSIAISGSHFGVKQAAFIKQNVNKATIFCDGDEAGAQVGMKLGSTLLEQGLKVRILYIDGKDPDDIARYSKRFDWDDLQNRMISPVKFAYIQEGIERALSIAASFKNKIQLSEALRELSEISGYEERHIEHWLTDYQATTFEAVEVKPQDTDLKLNEELLLLAAFRHQNLPVSKYLRLKLNKSGINLKQAETDGFLQEMAAENKYASRLHMLAQVPDIEKYTEDLKFHLTINFLTRDIKQLKRKLRSSGDLGILEKIEKKAKQISLIKAKLKGSKNGKSRNSSSSKIS